MKTDESGRVTVLDERATDRWRGLTGAALLAVAIGVLGRSPGLVLLAALAAALGAYARTVSPPPVTLAVEREVDPADPGPDERVAVAVTVRNVGEATLPDVRFADDVPTGARVTNGVPRCATALAPGASTTLRYEVTADGRRLALESCSVALRDVAGLVERRARIEAATRIAWPPALPADLPAVQPVATAATGPVPLDRGGEGQSFHAVREYRAGDPLRRVDWRHLARTGEVATVEYRPQRTATVVVVVDVRAAAALAPEPTAPTARERAVAAASALVDGLVGDNHAVGLAALGVDAYESPGRSDVHRERCQDALATTFAGGGDRADRGNLADGGGRPEPPAVDDDDDAAFDPAAAAARLADRVPGGADLLVCTPLCDEASATVIAHLATRSLGVTVLSPDPTTTGSPGRDLVRLERSARIGSLRARGLAVRDWPADADLDRVLATTGDGARRASGRKVGATDRSSADGSSPQEGEP